MELIRIINLTGLLHQMLIHSHLVLLLLAIVGLVENSHVLVHVHLVLTLHLLIVLQILLMRLHLIN
jgi:hypothetical protein